MRRPRKGFSLVLSLTIMAGMVMLVIVLAAFLQVESKLALAHNGYMRARFNALVAAKIAIGQLQQLAGPDQRVTMRADLYADDSVAPGAVDAPTIPNTLNPTAPVGRKLSHQKRYWTGVWATGGVNSSKVRDWNVMDPHSSRLFLGWLTSPGVMSTTDPEVADAAKLPNYLANRNFFDATGKVLNPATYEGQKLIDDLANPIAGTPDGVLIPLVGRGSVQLPTSVNRFGLEYSGQIDALPVPLPGATTLGGISTGINGRYAFWVGDEGLKAKANLPDAYAVTATGGSFTSVTDWDAGFRASAAQRSAIEAIKPADKTDLTGATLLPTAFTFGLWREADITTASKWDTLLMRSVKDRNALTLWANKVGNTAAGDAMIAASKTLWHDVTPWSFSTLTDTYNGGIKMDLSTAFEIPYADYRALETYAGQKNATITTDPKLRRPSLFHGAAGPTDLDFNRPNMLDFMGSTSDLLKSAPRSPEWAPRFMQSALGSGYATLKNLNGGETPERMGFVYEIPLRSNFFTGVVTRPSPFSGLGPADTDNLDNRIIRGPTWDLYRNYYRMYKRELETAGAQNKIRGQDAVSDSATVMARGIEPLSYSAGDRGVPVAKQGTATFSVSPSGFFGTYPGGGSTNDYHYRNNYSSEVGPPYRAEGGSMNPTTQSTAGIGTPTGRTGSEPSDSSYDSPRLATTRLWPTSMKVAPSIIRFSLMYSVVWNDDMLGIAVDPLITVHNPYDSALEFEGIAMLMNAYSLSHLFEFYVGGQIIGDVFPGTSFEEGREFSFRAVAGSSNGTSPSNIFRLEPGEVRVLSSTKGPLRKFETNGNNQVPGDFVYEEQSRMFFPVDAYAGLRRADGSAIVPETNVTLQAVQNVLPGWDGTIPSLNSIATARNLSLNVRVRNEGGVALGGTMFLNNSIRGGGHVVDGGYQHWNFYLLNEYSHKNQQLSWGRRWFGTTDDTRQAGGQGAVRGVELVNEPLLLNLRCMTSGWPMYGNANRGYTVNSDPEFGAVQGFGSEWSRSLQLPPVTILRFAGQNQAAWSNAGSAVDKQKFFIMDMLARGAKESYAGNNWYPQNSAYVPNGDFDRMKTPEEIRSAPMSPYVFSTRASQAFMWAYDGKTHAPANWIMSQRAVDQLGVNKLYDLDNSSRNRGYWGKSVLVGQGGNTNVVLFPIPRRPLLSLAQLGDAATAQTSTEADLTVGASFAHPGIKSLTKVCDWPGTKGGGEEAVIEHGYVAKASGSNIVRHNANVRTDDAFAANLALWDSYFFSGLNAQVTSYSDAASAWPSGPNLPTDAKIKADQALALTANGVTDLTKIAGIKDALDKGSNPLANKRVAYAPATGGQPFAFPHPAFIPTNSLYDGGFNVNSTSKAAWKAVLGSLRGQKIPDASGVSTGTALTRFARAFGNNDGANSPWTAYRELTDSEIDTLAAAVVKEVRKRGPFMSLSDFINRRLIASDNFGLKGALQAAIDSTSINDQAINNAGGTFAAVPGQALSAPYLPLPAQDRFPTLRSMSKTGSQGTVSAGLGAPGIVTQKDVLNSIGPNLTARSDTFVVRAYGEALDNSGNPIGKAWIEVVVQRTTEFVGPAWVEPNRRKQDYRNNNGSATSEYDTKPIVDQFERTPLAPGAPVHSANVNRLFGRRFKATSTRWLNANEI